MGWQKEEADRPFEWWAGKVAVLNYSELKTDYHGKSKPRSKAALPPLFTRYFIPASGTRDGSAAFSALSLPSARVWAWRRPAVYSPLQHLAQSLAKKACYIGNE